MCQLMGPPTYGTFFKIFVTILYTNTLKPHPISGTFILKFMPKKCPTNRHMTVHAKLGLPEQ